MEKEYEQLGKLSYQAEILTAQLKQVNDQRQKLMMSIAQKQQGKETKKK